MWFMSYQYTEPTPLGMAVRLTWKIVSDHPFLHILAMKEENPKTAYVLLYFKKLDDEDENALLHYKDRTRNKEQP